MDMSPTDVGYKFRSPAARKLIAKFQFIEQRGGFFQNVADISILYKIFGTHVIHPARSQGKFIGPGHH